MSQLPIGNSSKRSLHTIKCKDAYTAEKNLAQIARRKLGTPVSVKCQQKTISRAKQQKVTPNNPKPQLTARKKSISMVDLSPETESVDKRFLFII